MSNLLRLNRLLASAGVASRRRCDELIRAGRVAVNGAVITELGTKVDSSADRIVVDGVEVFAKGAERTLVLHKPREVLVAARDSRGRRTVMDLLADVPGRVFPVGRLDFRSEGLLLLTDDGDLAFRLAHPRFKVEKTYRVEVLGTIASNMIDALRRGVVLEDGPTQPAVVRILQREAGKTTLEFVLREGRKRQIRRMLALFGLRVDRLIRTHFGPIALGDLPTGNWRLLQTQEVELLRVATRALGEISPESKGSESIGPESNGPKSMGGEFP